MGLEPLTRSTHASSVLEFSNLSYTVKVKKGSPKVLVDDVSFSIRAGEMLGESREILKKDSRHKLTIKSLDSYYGTVRRW